MQSMVCELSFILISRSCPVVRTQTADNIAHILQIQVVRVAAHASAVIPALSRGVTRVSIPLPLPRTVTDIRGRQTRRKSIRIPSLLQV